MAMSRQEVFTRLRQILAAHSSMFSATEDSPQRYCLAAPVGPATLRAWRGKARLPPTIPVAWVEVRKAYVSYHLMGMMGNPKLTGNLSAELRSRMQGKSCFNFRAIDERLMDELERVTAKALRGMKRAGFVSDAPVA